jgi:RNA ligase (TIGR02306 family)
VVKRVERHPNADKLEVTSILGWKVVTRLGEVVPGQKVVYLEVDSVIHKGMDWVPDHVKAKMGETMTIQTIKLRGQLSQGLIVPLPNLGAIGDCLTERLGVTKAPDGEQIDAGGQPFPVHLVDKTEQIRIQSEPDLINRLLGHPYDITVKHDGTSATFLWIEDEFVVCSRNQRAPRPSVYWDMAAKYDIAEKLRGTGLAIQGEICGPKIQKNLLGLEEPMLYVFNVIDLKTRQRGFRVPGIPTVFHVESGGAFHYDTVEKLLLLAEGKYPGTKNEREGIVVTGEGGISFKVISNKYLLKVLPQ